MERLPGFQIPLARIFLTPQMEFVIKNKYKKAHEGLLKNEAVLGY
jgi:hypothetical protein